MHYSLKYYLILLLILPGTLKKSYAQQPIIDSLLNVLNVTTIDSNKVNLLFTLSDLYKSKSYDSTLHYAKSAQLIAEKSKDSALMMGLSMKLMNTALFFRQNRKFAEAEALIMVCMSLREKTGDEYSLIGAYLNLSINYYNNRKYDKGIIAGIKAKEMALKYLDSPDSTINAGAMEKLGNCLFWLGQIHYEKGEFETAIRNFTESVFYRDLSGNQRTKAQSLAGLARIYVKQNNYPKAITYFNESLSLYKEKGILPGITMVLRSLGNIYELKHDYSKSLTYYNNSLSIQLENSMDFELHITYQMLGCLYLQIGSLHEIRMYEVIPSFKVFGFEKASRILTDTAGYFLSLAYEISKQKDDELIVIKCLQGLADISIMHKEFDKAILQLKEVVTLAVNLDAKAELFEGYRSLSLVSEKLNQYEDAYTYYKLYSALKDSVFNENTAKQIAEIQIKFETEIKDRKIELLNKDNEIKSLQLEQKETSIRASELESEKNLDELRILIASKDLQELQLAKANEELDNQHLQSEVQAAELALIIKDKKIQEEKLARQKVQRDGIFIITVFLILVGFLLFHSQHLRKKLEKQEAIVQERKRISADLHDDIGTGLSKISLLSELVKSNAILPETKKEAEKISATSKQLLQSISEIIWALNANNDYVENLVAYIRRYAAEYFDNSSMKLKIITPDFISHAPISGERRRNIFFTVKEALHNVVKHAEATEVELNFSVKNDVLSVVIHDNGKGIPHGEVNRFGNGLVNMQQRMKSIHGNFSIENHVGTKITITVPLEDNPKGVLKRQKS